MRVFRVILLVSVVLITAQIFAESRHACITPSEASQMLNKDVCIAAHVYDVVQLPDRTTFLDTCAPQISDVQCRFVLVSYWEDHSEVGELRKYRDMDVHVRGIVRSMHGREGILVSHERQFRGGPPKFRPNPMLLRGLNGDETRTPVRDPNLRSQGAGRAFMNSNDKQTLLGR